jgi:hypothetical protein
MQLSLIDPVAHPVVTKAMLDDAGLRGAIRLVRQRDGVPQDAVWPIVERVGDISGVAAWAVDDGGMRYVAVNGRVFTDEVFWILNEKIRTAAMDVFGRLNWNAAHPGLAS